MEDSYEKIYFKMYDGCQYSPFMYIAFSYCWILLQGDVQSRQAYTAPFGKP